MVLAAAAIVVALALAISGYVVTTRGDSPSASEIDRSAATSTTVPASAPAVPASPAPSTPAPSAPAASSPAAVTTDAALEVGVVDVNTRLAYQSSAAAGTGILLTATGEVLTNNHVIDGATSVTVRVVATGKTYSATVLGSDETNDVALLKLKDASNLEPVKVGDSSAVQVGDAVTAVGNAGGDGGAPSHASGTVTGLDQQITATDATGGNAEQLTGLIEMNARLQPGDSGGPLFNAAGEVVGMNTAASGNRRFQTRTADAYAIPIQKAMDIVHQIESGQASATVTIGVPGFLGVGLEDGTNAAGAVINEVISGTAAADTGLQVGDVITAVDGHSVDSPDAVSAVLRTHHPGDKVALDWTDGNGQSRTATVTLGTGPMS